VSVFQTKNGYHAQRHRPKLLCIGGTHFCSFDTDTVRKFGRDNLRNILDLLVTLFGREPCRSPIVTLLDLRAPSFLVTTKSTHNRGIVGIGRGVFKGER
jgi:hypothetical protein